MPRDTRARLLSAAATSFLQHGYEATTLEQIADQLGITRPAVLYHFKTKEALLSAITEPVIETIRETVLDAPVRPAPTKAEQTATVRRFVDVLADNRAVIALMARFTTASQIGDIGSKLFALNERATRAMIGGAFDTDPLARVRGVAAHATLVGVMSARLPVDLDEPAARATLTDGIVALLNA